VVFGNDAPSAWTDRLAFFFVLCVAILGFKLVNQRVHVLVFLLFGGCLFGSRIVMVDWRLLVEGTGLNVGAQVMRVFGGGIT
jgi:hypothetical protein